MANCNGNCAGCSGCARELVLTAAEIDFLDQLGQIPFLPVARNLGDLTPIYLEEGEEKQAHYALVLQCLEKKGLVSLDYDKPLRNCSDPSYDPYPIRGSISLTERGQKVLQMLEYQGFHRE